MFENSLMIIKPDYMHKRRPVLLKLLAEDFQIQGSRKIVFSPETAAEFYADYADEKGFMLEVILLSKGPSEAFILTRENGVQELLNIMICYFGSASEMERNIHVTKHPSNVAREINFIFPNYIHEPTTLFDSQTFCNRPMVKPLLAEIYAIMQNTDCSQDNWKVRVAEYLERSNPSKPLITNQCMVRPEVGLEERAQQTTMSYPSPAKDAKPKIYKTKPSSTPPLSSTSPHSSMLLSSSSCVTCGGFDRSQPCISELDLNKRLEPQDTEPVCLEEEIIWKEIVVYEEVMPEEEEGIKDYQRVEEEEEEGEGVLDGFGGLHSEVESDHSVEAAAPPPPDDDIPEELPVDRPAEEAPVEPVAEPEVPVPVEEAAAEEAPAEEPPAEN